MLPRPDERIALFERYMARQRALAAEGKQRPAYRVHLGKVSDDVHH